MQMEKKTLSHFKQKPSAIFGLQHLNYNLRRISQQTPSAQRASGNPWLHWSWFLPWTLKTRADLGKYQVPVCKAKLASGTRTNTSLNTTPSYFTQRNSLRQQLLQIISHTQLYIHLSFWQNQNATAFHLTFLIDFQWDLTNFSLPLSC